MKSVKKLPKTLLALLICSIMLISMLPASFFAVFALSQSEVTLDIAGKIFIGEVNEFTVTTDYIEDDTAKGVIGKLTIVDQNGADATAAIDTLEYWDETTNSYKEFYGVFGPENGFRLKNAPSKFRVAFKGVGNFTVKVEMLDRKTQSVYLSDEKDILVKVYEPSELVTNIDSTVIVNTIETEFTYGTIAHDQEGIMVLGTFSVLDSDLNDAGSYIKKLEYWDALGNCYREFYGDFGPAATGFPLTDATTKFRVTFNKPGVYTVNTAMKTFDGGEILCSSSKTITVHPNSAVLTTDIATKEFEATEPMEFTYTTTANDFLNTMVLGKFTLKKDGVDVDPATIKLEYWDVTGNCYREFYGDFGPAATGFPLTDATSQFRVTIKYPGTYEILAQMVAFDGGDVLCKNITTIQVEDTQAPVIQEIKGNPTDWTEKDVVLEVIATDNNDDIAEYRIGEDGQWQTSNIFTVTENGKYVFFVRDSAGKVGEKFEIEVKHIDKVAPVISGATYDPNDWTNQSVKITVSATDFGVGKIFYKMDDGQWQDSNEFIVADNVIHKFYVKDSLGNISEATEVAAVHYDETAPVISAVEFDGKWVPDKVEITVIADDDASKGIMYKLNDGEYQSENTFTIIENGTYKVYAKDAAGNESAAFEVVISNIDTTPPEIVDFTSTTEKWTNSNVVISGTAKDDEASIVKVLYKIGEDGQWMELPFDADGKFSLTVDTECNATYIFKCINEVGFESPTVVKTIVKIDNTPAEVTIGSISDAWNNKQVTIFGSLSDSASGIASAVYDNGMGDKGEFAIIGNLAGGDFKFDTNVKASGVYSYTITVTDKAGNVTTVKTANVKIDLDKPVVSVDPATGWTNQAVTVVVGAEDAHAGINKVYYEKNDGVPVEINKVDGTYQFTISNKENNNSAYEIYTVDMAGNKSESVVYTAMIDVTSPATPVIIYGTSVGHKVLETLTFGLYKAPVTVTVAASDDLSGLKEIRYYLDSEEFVATPVNGKIFFEIKPDQKYTVTAIAVDNAGNVSNKQNLGNEKAENGEEIIKDTISGVIVDATAPTVDSIQADITDWTNDKVVISGTTSDNLSGVVQVYWKQSNTGEEQTATLNDDGSYTFTISACDYAGPIYVGAYDATGNKAAEKALDVRMDITKPVVEKVEADVTDWTNGKVVISGTTSDNLSGVVQVYWRQGDADEEQTATRNDDGSYTFTISARDYASPIYVGAYDAAGNKAAEKALDVRMDITKPVVEKVEANITGWTNSSIFVTSNVADNLSGVVQFYWKQGAEGEEQAATRNDDGSYKFIISSRNYAGLIYVGAYDAAGNKADEKVLAVQMDITKPVVNEVKASTNDWTNGKVVITGTVADVMENNVESGVKLVQYAYDTDKTGTAIYDAENGTYTFTVPATNYDGKIKVWCIDAAGNVSDEKTVSVKMDTTKPQVNSGNADPADWTNTQVIISGTVSDIEANSAISGIKIVKYKYNNGQELTANLNGNTYTIEIPRQDYKGNVTVWCIDNADNKSDELNVGVQMDITNPYNVTITYGTSVGHKVLETLTFGLYQAPVTVTIAASDDLSGLKEIRYYLDNAEFVATPVGNKISFIIEPDHQFKVSAIAVDNAGNDSSKQNLGKEEESNKDISGVIVDATAPIVESVQADITGWTNGQVVISSTVSDNLSGVVRVYWRQGDNGEEQTITRNEDGSYVFIISARNYAGPIYVGAYDAAGNKAAEKALDVQMDITKPVVNEVKASTNNWTNGNVVITGTVADKEKNYVASGVETVQYAYDNETGTATYDAANGTYTFTVPATNYDGEIKVWCIDKAGNVSDEKTVSVKMDTTKPQVNSGSADPATWTNKQVIISGTVSDIEANSAISGVKTVKYKYNNGQELIANLNGNTYTIAVPRQDYKGNVTVWCIDNAGNKSDELNVGVQMDITNPGNVTITYSEPLISKFINMVTFGFYRIDKELTVTITATDNLALKEIQYAAIGTEGANNTKDASFGGTTAVTAKKTNDAGDVIEGSISFKVPAQFKGKIEAIAYDWAGNSTAQKANTNNYGEVVVDTVAPDIKVTYEAADKTNTKVQFIDAQKATVDTFAKAQQALYNGKVNATIVITENNFFEGAQTESGIVHQVGILVTKTDNNGVVTKTEYLPVGATKLYNEATETVAFTWHTEGNKHTVTIPYEQDADYVISVKYTDFSNNNAEISANDGLTGTTSYSSKTVTVDTIAPVVTVDYENIDVKATNGARKYFTANQYATITVKEHNFRADDFKALITAKYSDGTDVTFVNDAKWTTNGDTHTLRLEYVVDANYTFDFTFADLAQNAAADYAADEFTVDKVDPNNLTVKYEGDVKTSITDKVLNVLTFGYYDAKVKVTITADDAVSGIDHFVYSYIKGTNVSNVNASLENVTIASKNITQKGKTFTATFEIPKDVLQGTNQFNGTVEFTAFDRSTRNTQHKETATIIVDNIAPTATITYNKPVQNANDISYYAGKIEAKIVITEANFHKEDVIVKVNDAAVDVEWIDDSVDIHTGTFTLIKDGNYVVTVAYADRSENNMALYTSNQLTIDTQAPVVNVSKVVNDSANTDAKYSFTITAKDTNMDASAFKPVLAAVVMNEDGTFATKDIALGNISTVKAGVEYRFTVENLEDDAIYTLSCAVADMSGNKYSKVVLEDGKAYENVQFSINRKGSTFGISDSTAALIKQYYVQNVTENLVIFETNVDPLTEYKVTVNGKALTKGTDYTVSEEGGNGNWKKYAYTINKDLFAEENEYKVVVSSKDKATNDAFSDVKDATVNFVVDRTAPIVTITGMAPDGRYKTDRQTVTLIPTDDGGALYSLVVRTVDENGNVIQELKNLSGDDLKNALEESSGKVTFEIAMGLYQNIEIICNDSAVDSDGKTNSYQTVITNVSVDTNGFIVNFWANKPLRWGTIAGVIVLAAVGCFLLVLKRKKKN